jgi:hypothetical protein
MGCAAFSYQEMEMPKNSKKLIEIKGEKAGQDQNVKASKSAPSKQVATGTGLTPWLSFRTGLIIITVCSIGMAILTTWQSIEGGIGWVDSILYGLLFGALIWVIFYVSQVFFRWLRR